MKYFLLVCAIAVACKADVVTQFSCPEPVAYRTEAQCASSGGIMAQAQAFGDHATRSVTAYILGSPTIGQEFDVSAFATLTESLFFPGTGMGTLSIDLELLKNAADFYMPWTITLSGNTGTLKSQRLSVPVSYETWEFPITFGVTQEISLSVGIDWHYISPHYADFGTRAAIVSMETRPVDAVATPEPSTLLSFVVAACIGLWSRSRRIALSRRSM